MTEEQVLQKIALYTEYEGATVVQQILYDRPTDLIALRDALLDVGEILEEDLEGNAYVARISVGGFFKRRPIVVVATCDDGVRVAAVDIPGERGKRASFEAIGVFDDALQGHPRKPRRRHVGLWIAAVILLLAAILVVVVHQYVFPYMVMPAQSATVQYNAAVEEFNSIVPEYNDAAEDVDVSNISDMVPKADVLSLQGTDYLSICGTLFQGNNATKIEKDAETIKEMASALKSDLNTINAINNPDESWVASCLKNVDGIERIMPVTVDNDPNGLLNIDGGYSSCTYFTSSMIDAEWVKGSDPVRKGVDGGGAVEVYPTLEDARARCEYLAGFDDTVLYSGSYAIVGTMVIRTSCLLDDRAQYVLTDSIVRAMTVDSQPAISSD